MKNEESDMPDKLLEIRDLHVMYKTDEDDIYALNGIDLSIGKGETLGLVGETGAGKTTIALGIMKLLPPKTSFITGGEILFEGKSLNRATEADMRIIRGKDISMIFADPMSALNPIHTVGAQVAEALELHFPELGRKAIEEKVDEIMEMVGIPADRKVEYPHQFSGGMKQRIVIAIALACKPRLLLADEPTSALDVTIQAQVLNMMNQLKDKLNTSMLLITHDLGVVAQVCDHVAIVYAGKIIEKGTAEDVFEGARHHPYTVGLFGSIPDMTTSSSRLTPIEGLMPDPTQRIPGCRFAERCPRCMGVCRTAEPEAAVEGTHEIRCHLFSMDDAIRSGGK
jgi:peptide/nickel transport system ATP-binding protein